MVERTVNTINRQFQQEVLSMLEEFQTLREKIAQKERENKELRLRTMNQEMLVSERNNRLLQSALIEIEREEEELELEEPEDPN